MNRTEMHVVGYVFLSDPDHDYTVLVEPDGTLWVPDETTRHFVPGRPCVHLLCRLTDYANTSDIERWRRSWGKGYLPILSVTSGDGTHAFVLLMMGKALFLKHTAPGGASTVTVFPERRDATEDEFQAACNHVRQWWHSWLSGVWLPPEESPLSQELVLACLVQARCAFTGDAPMYGAGYYGRSEHGGFPPTTLTSVDCYWDYMLRDYACRLLDYFFEHYVTSEGRIDYYGPSIAEYGQLLALTANIASAGEQYGFPRRNEEKLAGLCRYLISRIGESEAAFPATDIRHGLIAGVPEADEAKYPEKHGYYFHNNAAVLHGFFRMIVLYDHTPGAADQARRLKTIAAQLESRLRRAMRASMVNVPGLGGVIPPQTGQLEYWRDFASSREASYANYRYYPELLETGLLERTDALQIIKARERLGGEREGMTLFFTKPEHGSMPHLDNWTLASYGKGLLNAGLREKYLNVMVRHALHYLTRDTHTAYEQVAVDSVPCRPYADFCVPAQLVAPRMLKWWHDSRGEGS